MRSAPTGRRPSPRPRSSPCSSTACRHRGPTRRSTTPSRRASGRPRPTARCPARRRRAPARSADYGARSSSSTSGPRGASRAATRCRCSRRRSKQLARRGGTVLGDRRPGRPPTPDGVHRRVSASPIPSLRDRDGSSRNQYGTTRAARRPSCSTAAGGSSPSARPGHAAVAGPDAAAAAGEKAEARARSLLVAVALLAARRRPPQALASPTSRTRSCALECGDGAEHLEVAAWPTGSARSSAALIAAGHDQAADQGPRSSSEYGPDVLAEPKADGFNLAAWLVPIAAGARRRRAASRCSRGAGAGAAAARPARRRPAAPALDPDRRAAPRRRARAYDRPVSDGVDTTVVAAFAVGFVSFISPCVLPLVPGYLSAVSGVSVGRAPARRALAASRCCCRRSSSACRSRPCSSRSGMTATGLGSTLQDSRGTLDKVAGIVIIALGRVVPAHAVRAEAQPRVAPGGADRRAGSGGPLIAGAAFAFAWTPCIGPTLGAILTAASERRTPSARAPSCCSSTRPGLAVPFLLTAVAFTRAHGGVPLAARPLH